MSGKCLICYKPTENGSDYHIDCCKKFYGSDSPPIIPYKYDQINELAKLVIKESVTVPGVQSKLSLDYEKAGEKGKLTIVGLWGNFILKPPSEKYAEITVNEDLTMHMAELLEIKVVPHALIRLESGEICYITRRIDRKSHEKIHMEDFCQIAGYLTENKYKGSMETIGKIILKYSSNPYIDLLSLFEIALFSYISGNADMHLKNFSFIFDNNLIKFSPAYDLLSTRLIIPKNLDNEEMALPLNGKKSNFRIDDFTQYAGYLKLNRKQINNTYSKFSDRFTALIDKIEESFLSDVLKKNYKELLTERYRNLNL